MGLMRTRPTTVRENSRCVLLTRLRSEGLSLYLIAYNIPIKDWRVF